jgi:hypothetical protein
MNTIQLQRVHQEIIGDPAIPAEQPADRPSESASADRGLIVALELGNRPLRRNIITLTGKD